MGDGDWGRGGQYVAATNRRVCLAFSHPGGGTKNSKSTSTKYKTLYRSLWTLSSPPFFSPLPPLMPHQPLPHILQNPRPPLIVPLYALPPLPQQHMFVPLIQLKLLVLARRDAQELLGTGVGDDAVAGAVAEEEGEGEGGKERGDGCDCL